MIHDGLWDPYNDLHMGNCAELCAAEYKLSREDQDAFSVESYRRAREAWEKRYASARERFEAHKKQLSEAQKADADAASDAGEATSYSSDAVTPAGDAGDGGGSLASDEALAALREKLAGR